MPFNSKTATLAAILAVPSVFLLGYAVGQSPKEKMSTMAQKVPLAVKSPIVGVFIEGVARQIDIKDLQVRYPGNTAQKIDPGALRADAIVGWYDKGNNFHEQKMQNNVNKIFGGERIFTDVLRGTALRGVSVPAINH